MEIQFYPLQFDPIFKERLWGGSKLKTVLHKSISSHKIGESWEISTVEGDVSIIANGVMKGKLLTEAIQEFPLEILGTIVYERFGNQFPLLFKYLDAKEDLSVQVHPNDDLAKLRHDSFGKTEMWYVIQADIDAKLIVGFKEAINATDYLENLNNKTLLHILNQVAVYQGDAFLIQAGTVHAIGAGTVIAEIQQNSDITYRLYDFDRVDSDGNLRELHVDLALDTINYNAVSSQKQYQKNSNQSNPVVDCPYFTSQFIPLEGQLNVLKSRATFTVYMCVDGQFEIVLDEQHYSYSTGDTILVPAVLTEFQLVGKASILEIYIS
ncbi:MAG: class I mannose-6-phosphate isomerase [Flavobacterium sp.]|nr:class I mannose-6-phosphate isomerase [Flavobacterium sp.]